MSTIDPTRPTVAEVSRLIRARTKDDGGHEVGVFNAETRPTDVQVQDLIILAEGDVLSQTGRTLDELQAGSAKSLVALRAAMFVELSYWPEQVRSDRSAYEEYKRLYDEGLAGLMGVLYPDADGDGGGPGPAKVYEYGSVPITSWTQSA